MAKDLINEKPSNPKNQSIPGGTHSNYSEQSYTAPAFAKQQYSIRSASLLVL
jgi:hypothetical protein